MKAIFIIWLGGGLGSIFRYLMQLGVGRYITERFPVGTVLVNITGCFIIGVLYGLSDKYAWLNPGWQLFLVTGLCGGFTTFSGFSFESIALARQGNYLYCVVYIVSSVVIGIMSTVGGAALFKG
ncbi:MAG: fluoride efflux transporter CrcB [Bacteroidota bacterium]